MTTTPPATKPGPKERRFLDALRDIFVGVKVDGQSGFINLMRIKAAYFQKVVEPALMEDLAKALRDFPEFREELFDKLYSFFSRYFSRSGSICFAYTPQHMSVYEKVYTDEQDVVLFWKTHMLYFGLRAKELERIRASSRARTSSISSACPWTNPMPRKSSAGLTGFFSPKPRPASRNGRPSKIDTTRASSISRKPPASWRIVA